MILSFALTALLIGPMNVGGSSQPPAHHVRDATVERMLQNKLPRRTAYDLSSIPQIHGAILNHHIPHATGLNIALYEALSKRRAPSTIVILGPNHQDIGSWPVATTDRPFRTAFGIVPINQRLLAPLIHNRTVHVLHSLFDIEHSIYAQVIPIAQYFPDTTILPLTFTSTYSLKNAEALGTRLASILDPDALVIASIDFSHYHTVKQASLREDRSRSLIQTLRVAVAKDVDTDSKQSLAVLLAYLRARGDRAVQILEQSNSSVFGGSPLFTTGYIIAAMGAKK